MNEIINELMEEVINELIDYLILWIHACMYLFMIQRFWLQVVARSRVPSSCGRHELIIVWSPAAGYHAQVSAQNDHDNDETSCRLQGQIWN